MGKEQISEINATMNEVINHVEGILESYNISFKQLNSYTTRMLLQEASNATRLKKYFKERFNKDIKLAEAKELEILFQTYQYLSQN
jgi:predicted translin family RNA/ssDNA-binding protein